MPQSLLILASLLVLSPSVTVSAAGEFPSPTHTQRPAAPTTRLDDEAVNRTGALMNEVIASSYPELKGSDIRIKAFRSRSDYFKTRFGVPQYFRKMRYLMYVNPRAFELQAPEAGVRAIIAHELAHVLYFQNRNRVRLLGLVRLISKRYTARFERRADLKAISLGYGEGLKEYRRWLYGNVPASKLGEKQQNYFSPEEIDAIQFASRTCPALLDYWVKHVPLSLDQIVATKCAQQSKISRLETSKRRAGEPQRTTRNAEASTLRLPVINPFTVETLGPFPPRSLRLAFPLPNRRLAKWRNG